jgi:hypothetical protein
MQNQMMEQDQYWKDRLGELRRDFERQLAEQKGEYEERCIKHVDAHVEGCDDVQTNLQQTSRNCTIADEELVAVCLSTQFNCRWVHFLTLCFMSCPVSCLCHV